MSYVKNVHIDRVVEFPHRYKDQALVQYTFTVDPGTITAAGTLVSAAWLNHIEQGIYDATYPAYIDNATTPNNCRIAMADLGAWVSRNVADANAAFIIDQHHASSTGLILDCQLTGTSKFSVAYNGWVQTISLGVTDKIYSDGGIVNYYGANYSTVNTGYYGAIISRNVADANSALTVNQVHASSTGPIINFQAGGVTKTSIAMNGTIECPTLVAWASGICSAYGATSAQVFLPSTGTTIIRNEAGAGVALTANLRNAGATGNIFELQWQDTLMAGFSREGMLSCAGIASLTALSSFADGYRDGDDISAPMAASCAVYDVLYMTASGFNKAKSDSATTMPCVAMCMETGTGTRRVKFRGVIKNTAWNWTVPGWLYVDPSTAGALTQTMPASGKQVQPVALVLDADTIYFAPGWLFAERV